MEFSGVIKKGAGLGSKISYPTINIVVPKDEEKSGVYACKVEIGGREFEGAGYVGEKKGLAEDEYICEVFLFEDCGDVYGAEARIKLVEKIRDVQKVKNLEELKSLIYKDVKNIKENYFGY
jgi:riboflavin kinase / FMN adenylyltransferase